MLEPKQNSREYTPEERRGSGEGSRTFIQTSFWKNLYKDVSV
jgi:hypothetical protein